MSRSDVVRGSGTSDDLIREARADLRAKAEAATPGPWVEEGRAIVQDMSDYHDVVSCDVDCAGYCYGGTGRGIEHRPDAKFIAAANPAVILELLDALDAAESRATEAEAAREDAAWAVIEKARSLHYPHKNPIHTEPALVCAHRHCVDDAGDQVAWPCPTGRILSSAPADVLRERDAEKWDEGAQWAAVELGVIDNERQAWITPTDNPYRSQS